MTFYPQPHLAASFFAAIVFEQISEHLWYIPGLGLCVRAVRTNNKACNL